MSNRSLPPCSTHPTPLPSRVAHLTLDLTGLAQRVALAASLPDQGQAAATDPVAATVVTTLAIWEDLVGLSGPDAIDLAVLIADAPMPVTAAPIPL